MNEQEKTQNKIVVGKKLNMTQVFTRSGKPLPVTKIHVDDGLDLGMEEKEVTIIGKSKGKGFTGVIKRWNFHLGPKTRGQSDKHRAPGAIGAQTPGRVFKGKKMAGRSGNKKITLHGRKIVKVDLDKNELLIVGPVPGARNSKVTLRFN